MNSLVTSIIFTGLFIFPCFWVKADIVKVVTEYLPPFQIKMIDGSLGGYGTEVIAELFKLSGDTADVQVLPWARAYGIARKQPNVLIYSIAHTKDRDALFHWVGSLKYERFYFWGLKSRYKQVDDSFESLKELLIASANDYNTEQYLIDNGFKNTYKVVKSSHSLLMLEKGRVDILLSNELVLKSLSESIGSDFSQLKKLQEAKDLQNNLSIAFSLNSSPELIQRFKIAYRELLTSGKLAEIKRKWSIVDDNFQ
ncbi:MAG: ABC transporter substrate-binding protein [Colwellia sp.]|nr:ABC transporter substrate-binding protein [Colwellia sp.]